MTDINHLALETFGTRGRPQSKWKENFYITLLNNLIFQLLNHFILPSSMLARLVNIYMFRCNNKMLFVTNQIDFSIKSTM